VSDAAVDFYTKQFSSTARASWGGLPALVMIEGPSREALELVEIT